MFSHPVLQSAAAVAAEPKSATKVKDIGGDKNGGKRTVPVQKTARFYPTEDVPRPLANRKTAQPTKLRGSITPGTVLVILSGKFKGKVCWCIWLDFGTVACFTYGWIVGGWDVSCFIMCVQFARETY